MTNMIRYFKIDGDLDDELENKLLEVLNSLEEKDTLTIWITSRGGSSDVGDNLIDLINNDDRIVKVKFYWQVSSVAFRVMIGTPQHKRVINKDIWSIIHCQTRTSDYRDRLKEDYHTKFLHHIMDVANNEFGTRLVEIGISKDIVENQSLKGEDIYLTYEDIMKLKI